MADSTSVRHLIPMATPKFRRDPVRTRARIFEAAGRLFAEHGFAGVTIGHIADAARVNRRMVYVYFRDKEGLYRAVMEHAFELAWLPALASIEASHGREHPVEALRGVLLAYFDSLTANPQYVRLLAWEAAASWEVVNRFDSPVLRKAGERQREVFGKGVDAGIFRADLDPRLVPTVLVSLPLYFFLYRPRLVHSLRNLNPGVDLDGLDENARSLFADAALRALISPAALANEGFQSAERFDASHLPSAPDGGGEVLYIERQPSSA